MLDPQTGLFESADGGHTWQPCPLAHLQEQHLVYFEILGQSFAFPAQHHLCPCCAVFFSNCDHNLHSMAPPPWSLDQLDQPIQFMPTAAAAML